MLVGMDFLRDRRAKLDLDAGTLCLGDLAICMTCGRSPVPREAQVTLIRKLKVTAGSCPNQADGRATQIWGSTRILRHRRLLLVAKSLEPARLWSL